MGEKPELLPCPFCGGEAILDSYQSCDCCNKAWNGKVICTSVGCHAEVSHYDTDAEAIAAWNRRPSPCGGVMGRYLVPAGIVIGLIPPAIYAALVIAAVL